jgi:hypothetical protein
MTVRFEVRAAVALGILLPLLETYRRGLGHWRVELTTMFEDYLAGALLLAAAWAAYRRSPAQTALLLVAWGSITCMMTVSLVGQIERTIRGVDLEPRNGQVLLVKFLLLTVSAAALLRSFRQAMWQRDGGSEGRASDRVPVD